MEFRPQIIRYLHDCYREDNSRSVLWNLLGSNVEHQIFLEGTEELLDGFLDETPLPSKKAADAHAATVTYAKEKQLLYTAFPIVGKLALPDGKTRAVCSPLLTFPATIKLYGEYAALSIEREARRTNAGLLDALQSDDGDTPLYDLIEAALDDWHICEAEVAGLARVLTGGISDLEASTMWQFPKLTDARALRAAAGEATLESGFQIFPSAAVCLVRRPTESRGVLTELQEIADSPNPSRPLRTLISGEVPPPAEPDTSRDSIPAVLSHSQTNILQRARTEPLSLVIGPPGTGKSYTIAAIALDHLNRGQSVLIGSKMNHAVDVIANKIGDQLGGCGKVVRAGRRHYLRELKSYIDNLLNNPPGFIEETRAQIASTMGASIAADRELRGLEEHIASAGERHIRWGTTLAQLADGSRSIFKRLAGYLIGRRHCNDPPLWESVADLHELLGSRSYLIAELVKLQQELRIKRASSAYRRELKLLRAALGARTGTRQDEIFSSIDLEILLDIFPVWLVNLSDTHRVLPHRNELFDVAIIDEASQCDIASSLPLLQRAKRAVIVGDPKQLHHLSFLATDRQEEFATTHGLTDPEAELFNYRKHSILDLACERTESQACINFLNEHFRSEPSIIRFSNRHFYSERLSVMTEKPGRPSQPAIHHRQIEGERSEQGINTAESDAVVAAITEQLDLLGETRATSPPSIGVLSPFRAQVDHLAARVSEHFGNQIFTNNQALIGTAHTFQGEERDLMFLSFAIDADSPAASRRFLERPDLFNVAITRARQHQTIVTSVDPKSLPDGSLLRQYLASIDSANAPVLAGADEALAHIDRFAGEVKQELELRGIQVCPGCPVAGLKTDLLATNDGECLAIDLIGCPGPTSPVLPLERYKMFQRAGLTLWPLPYTDWFFEREKCIASIVSRLQLPHRLERT